MKEEEILEMVENGKLTWEGLIRDIIIDEGIDPWDIDIIRLANKFKEIIDKVNIEIAGKFLLVSSILLSMKSDEIFKKEEEEIDELIIPIFEKKEINIKTRVPIIKKRKITLNELINALKKAVEVKNKREKKKKVEEIKVKKIELKKVNIREKMEALYKKIISFFKYFERIPFKKLVPSWKREDIVWTFLPLIHLSAEHKLELEQEKEFGEIYVKR